MKKRIRDTPKLIVPQGYKFEEIYETDDTGYGYDSPVIEEEVEVSFGENGKEQNL